jgi:hypothetical protein
VNLPHGQGDYFVSKGFWAVEKAGTKWYINLDYENSIHTSYNINGENPPCAIYKMWGELIRPVLEKR